MFLMFTLEDFASSHSKSGCSIYGIICKSKNEATECCIWLDSVGRRWASGTSYLRNTHYEEKGGVIVYFDSDTFTMTHNIVDYVGGSVDFMEWSVLKGEIIREPDLLDSDSLDAMLKDIEVY